MKKVLVGAALLFALASCSSVPGTITFNDGSTVECDDIKYGNSTIKCYDEDANKREYPLESVQSVEFVEED